MSWPTTQLGKSKWWGMVWWLPNRGFHWWMYYACTLFKYQSTQQRGCHVSVILFCGTSFKVRVGGLVLSVFVILITVFEDSLFGMYVLVHTVFLKVVSREVDTAVLGSLWSLWCMNGVVVVQARVPWTRCSHWQSVMVVGGGHSTVGPPMTRSTVH